MNEMKNRIFHLVEDSHKGNNYPKALEYLLMLRKGCILDRSRKPKTNKKMKVFFKLNK